MVRYYGWYPNKYRGLRKKQATPMAGNDSQGKPDEHVEILDVSKHKSRRIPSKQWRECIKKIYETYPLCCPNCGGEMNIISSITDHQVIRQILKHFGLWTQRLLWTVPSQW